MREATVIAMPAGIRREHRLARVIETSRRLAAETRGRAWINGREVGGTDKRYAHLSRSHD